MWRRILGGQTAYTPMINQVVHTTERKPVLTLLILTPWSELSQVSEEIEEIPMKNLGVQTLKIEKEEEKEKEKDTVRRFPDFP